MRTNTKIEVDSRTRLCLKLLKVLLELHAAAHAPQSRRGGLAPWALRRVERFVEANLDRTIQVAELAGRAGLSDSHRTAGDRGTAVAAGAIPVVDELPLFHAD